MTPYLPSDWKNVSRVRSRVLRVVVAYEDSYRFYRQVLAKAIEDLRPHLQVRSVALGVMEATLERFDPHVVVCSRPNTQYTTSGGVGAWVELPVEPSEPGEICHEGQYEEAFSTELTKVLSVLDEIEVKHRRAALVENC
jgi:hypothetical protein